VIKKYPYWIYVVGVFVTWAIVLLIVRNFISSSRFHDVLIFCCGFLLGILGASVARKVYK
jgi:glucan phosphoethanolaminetransferase (alkaline phosphatase superfamily)